MTTLKEILSDAFLSLLRRLGALRNFTYEQLPGTLGNTPGELIGQTASLLSSLASADRPPVGQPLIVPNTGAAVGQALANIPE